MSEQPFRPERQTFLVHAAGAEEYGVLPEWWGAIGSEVQSRSLRFSDDGAVWLDEGELPSSLKAAGCKLTEVSDVAEYGGVGHPSLEVGRRVLLQPEPANPRDPNAVAVWAEDASQLVGYLPSELAAEIRQEAARRGTGYGAFVAAEERDTASGERRGLHIILGPGIVWAKQAG
jgi:HIRAN domain